MASFASKALIWQFKQNISRAGIAEKLMNMVSKMQLLKGSINVFRIIQDDKCLMEAREKQTSDHFRTALAGKAMATMRQKHLNLLKGFVQTSERIEHLELKMGYLALWERLRENLQHQLTTQRIAIAHHEDRMLTKHFFAIRQALLCRKDKDYTVKLKAQRAIRIWRQLARENAIDRAVETKAERWHRKKTVRKLWDCWVIQYNISSNQLMDFD